MQPSPADRRFDMRERAQLAAAWLIEELGQDDLFPSPECLALWSPDIEGELAEVLAGFQGPLGVEEG